MQNKSKSRTDIQWVISSISLAVSLGLWGLIASADKKGAGVSGQASLVQPPADPSQVVVEQQPQMLLPGQVLLFGGTAPQPQQAQTVITTASGSTRVTRHGGGGGSGGGGKPAGSTGSSKPKP